MKKKNEPSLARIIIALLLLFGVAFGGYRAYVWLRAGGVDGVVQASAPATVDTARQLVDQGKFDEARRALRPMASKAKDPGTAVTALMLLAEAELKAGDRAGAVEAYRRIASEFPTSPDRPKAAVAYARLLEEDGKYADALAIYTDIRENAPAELRAPALCGFARQAEREAKRVEARDLYAEAVKSAAWNSAYWNEALDALGRINVELIFSPEQTPDSKIYEIQKGDSFTSIGIKLNTTLGLLTRANGLDPDSRLNVGQRLKVTPKDFRIVIERSTCRLFLLDSNGIFKRYMTGLGKPGHETTLGVYKIGNKEKDPTWHKPGEGPIPPGDPRNELGTRWMPLVPVQEGLPRDLGIHGAIDPATVGTYASHGCARLRMDEVEELYDLVVRSTPVEIVETVEPASLNTLAVARL